MLQFHVACFQLGRLYSGRFLLRLLPRNTG
jgi:hypothetical protein